MRMIRLQRTRTALALAAAGGLLVGCSGPTEDVRVTFCKNLTSALNPEAKSIEWRANENSFVRPEYAITALTFEVVGQDGSRQSGTSACHYAYDAVEDTTSDADPFPAYATLPFKMTIDGATLSDAELLQRVNAEQRRMGRQVVETLQKGTRDIADKLRGAIER
jgi:hypothetical protein